MRDQVVLALVLLAAIGMFVWGRWRYDVVALGALLILIIMGVVPAEGAFNGFAHPAVITVAAVLVVSHGVRNSGAIDAVGRSLKGLSGSVTLQVLVLTAITAVCSAFMNNVGALAIVIPVAVQLARAGGNPPSLLLMPIAFGSLLGGMVTLIGTPSNIIIASYRAGITGESFGMFDFAPAGAAVAVVCVVLGGLVLWRLLPRREPAASREALFDIESYVAELRVEEESKAIGMTVGEFDDHGEGELTVIGIARGDRQIRLPSRYERLMTGDVLIVEGDAEAMKAASDAFGLSLEGNDELREEFLKSGEIELAECIVMRDGRAAGRTPAQLDLRRAYGVNVLGIARQGQRVRTRVSVTRFQAGDVLLLQGDRASLAAALPILGCLPLAERTLRLGEPRRIVIALSLLVAAIGLAVAGVLRIEVSLTACACLMVVTGLVSLRDAYDSVDWPVIVLLGSMLPVGIAMETTGGAARMAEWMLAVASGVPPWLAVGMHMAACMALANVINCTAAAVLMAPISVGLAAGLGVSPDAFLMSTAVGTSAAFLTPIGHQSNTLVMGPGGYRFTDYLRMGIPFTLLTLVVGTPAILWRWPLELPS